MIRLILSVLIFHLVSFTSSFKFHLSNKKYTPFVGFSISNTIQCGKRIGINVRKCDENYYFSEHNRFSHQRLFLSSNAGEHSTSTPTISDQLFTCNICGSQFSTRNLLFRHLREDEYCSVKSNIHDSNTNNNRNVEKRTILFQLGYINRNEKHDDTTLHSSKLIGEFVCKKLEKCLQETFSFIYDRHNGEQMIQGSTQVSVPKLRHSSLVQEDECHSMGDVMAITVTWPAQLHKRDNSSLLDKITRQLNRSLPENIQILSSTLLTKDNTPKTTNFHAERSCTQRAYHYIFPLYWLPGGDELTKWSLNDQKSEEMNRRENNNIGKSLIPPPNDSIRLFKEALRTAESIQIQPNSYKKSYDHSGKKRHDKIASGRFGLLASRKRTCWHNFADPKLQGDASPNNKPVWRVVDRSRIIKFIRGIKKNNDISSGDDNNKEEAFLVLEFKGDDFVPQQIRRIVGTSMAIVHGWLPSDFIAIATNPDTFIETILAPSQNMYLADSRFHFNEISNAGKNIFSSSDPRNIERARTLSDWQKRITSEIISSSNREEDLLWMKHVQTSIAPRIKQSIQKPYLPNIVQSDLSSITIDNGTIENKKETSVYTPTLTILRNITSSGKWPQTSMARSRVILKSNLDKDSKPTETIDSGSFTVINPKYFQKLSGSDHNFTLPNGIKLPLGNELFPELVEAVFHLESQLSIDIATEKNITNRPQSSHCAINRNAQFTPHVDSGRGLGQSLSMIVGLGNYAYGGKLMIEGTPYDIKYQPLEFNGWKLRHWTEPFIGERFSLVWFTPEMIGVDDK